MRSLGCAAVDDVDSLLHREVALGVFVFQLGKTYGLHDEGATNRLVKKALTKNVKLGKKLYYSSDSSGKVPMTSVVKMSVGRDLL